MATILYDLVIGAVLSIIRMSITLKEVTTIYTDNVDKIYKFFYYRTLSRPAAEDLTSETFLEFTNAVVKKKDIEDPSKYLYGIAKYVFIHFLERKYREKETVVDTYAIEQLNFGEHVDVYIQQVEQTPTSEERILPYINTLPEKQREIVTMRLIEKLSPTEIAAKIGKDTNYVKTTQKRGIKKLQQLVACTPMPTNDT